MTRINIAVAVAGAAFALAAGCAATAAPQSLTLERAITLPDVAGRIDHLAIDPTHQRLAVAELSNNSVDVVDIASGKLLHRIGMIEEPQGVAFDASGRLLLIASGGEGALRMIDAASFESAAALPLGDDADNVRIDPRNGHALVGYGRGALAVIDVATRSVLSKVALPAHPEGFQIDGATGRVYVNLPDARTIGVVDLDAGQLLDRWRLPVALWNYPLALAPSGSDAVSVFRAPGQLARFDRTSGARTGSASTCGDADDVFFDAKRSRIYVVCGDGGVDVFDSRDGGDPRRLGHTKTQSGARTGLFDPVLDRLFVAARSPGGGAPASILVFKPVD